MFAQGERLCRLQLFDISWSKIRIWLRTTEKRIQSGADFAKIAKQYSTCKLAKSWWWTLVKWKSGQLVSVIDKLVFTAAERVPHGPIKSQFGFHLVEVKFRMEGFHWGLLTVNECPIFAHSWHKSMPVQFHQNLKRFLLALFLYWKPSNHPAFANFLPIFQC